MNKRSYTAGCRAPKSFAFFASIIENLVRIKGGIQMRHTAFFQISVGMRESK